MAQSLLGQFLRIGEVPAQYRKQYSCRRQMPAIGRVLVSATQRRNPFLYSFKTIDVAELDVIVELECIRTPYQVHIAQLFAYSQDLFQHVLRTQDVDMQAREII